MISILLCHRIFLYYGRAIETQTLVVLNGISIQQVEPTKNTLAEADWQIDFVLWHPEGKICYFSGKMQLVIDSGAL